MSRFLRRRSSISYKKDELIDESELGSSSPTHTTNENTFDNPVYDEIKVDLGSEMAKTELNADVPTDAPAVLDVCVKNPILYPPDDPDEKKVPKLNEYEHL